MSSQSLSNTVRANNMTTQNVLSSCVEKYKLLSPYIIKLNTISTLSEKTGYFIYINAILKRIYFHNKTCLPYFMQDFRIYLLFKNIKTERGLCFAFLIFSLYNDKFINFPFYLNKTK